ncbi:MAG: cache domain-containing protein [Methanomassiliicoccales archaeon]
MISSQKLLALLAVVIALVLVEAGALTYLASESSQNKAAQEQAARQLELTSVTADCNGIINSLMMNIDRSTAQTAKDLKVTGLNGSGARAALDRGLQASNLIINMVTTDLNGIIIAAEPAQYYFLEGKSIMDQEPIVQMIAEQQPVISPLMMMVEGYHAVFVGYPVFDSAGKVNGTLTSLFRPDQMVNVAYLSLVKPRNLGLMVMQGDGSILFDPDPAQVGRNTFTDPMFAAFPQIQSVAWRMVNESTGLDTYTFTVPGQTTPVSKIVVWCTSFLMQANWTVAVNRVN